MNLISHYVTMFHVNCRPTCFRTRIQEVDLVGIYLNLQNIIVRKQKIVKLRLNISKY